jgi:putative endonuclease
MGYFIYIMASRPGGALYTGRTRNLRQQVEAHRAGYHAHTAKYKIKGLVWFEYHVDFERSVKRERAIKRWRRAWKIALITKVNPGWRDLTALVPDQACDEAPGQARGGPAVSSLVGASASRA